MRKRLFLLLIIVLGCAGTSLKADQVVRIRGKVVYEPTGKPLRNVTVKLYRPDRSFGTMIRTAGMGGAPEVLGLTKTNSAGEFLFETSRPRPYEIMCFRPGGHSGNVAANVDPKKFVLIKYKADPIPFTLRPGEKPPHH